MLDVQIDALIYPLWSLWANGAGLPSRSFGFGGERSFLRAEVYDAYALGGLEYFVNEDVAVSAEVQPAYVITPGDDNSFGINLWAGANHPFD